MVHILYNLNANCGNDKNNTVDYIKSKFSESKAVSLFEIDDLKAFFDTFSADDEVVLIGGDGTLNVVLNKLRGYDIKNNFYLYKGGTGND